MNGKRASAILRLDAISSDIASALMDRFPEDVVVRCLVRAVSEGCQTRRAALEFAASDPKDPVSHGMTKAASIIAKTFDQVSSLDREEFISEFF